MQKYKINKINLVKYIFYLKYVCEKLHYMLFIDIMELGTFMLAGCKL